MTPRHGSRIMTGMLFFGMSFRCGNRCHRSHSLRHRAGVLLACQVGLTGIASRSNTLNNAQCDFHNPTQQTPICPWARRCLQRKTHLTIGGTRNMSVDLKPNGQSLPQQGEHHEHQLKPSGHFHPAQASTMNINWHCLGNITLPKQVPPCASAGPLRAISSQSAGHTGQVQPEHHDPVLAIASTPSEHHKHQLAPSGQCHHHQLTLLGKFFPCRRASGQFHPAQASIMSISWPFWAISSCPGEQHEHQLAASGQSHPLQASIMCISWPFLGNFILPRRAS